MHGTTRRVGRAKIRRRTYSQCSSGEDSCLIWRDEVLSRESEEYIKERRGKNTSRLRILSRSFTSNALVRFMSRTMAIAFAGAPDAVANLRKDQIYILQNGSLPTMLYMIAGAYPVEKRKRTQSVQSYSHTCQKQLPATLHDQYQRQNTSTSPLGRWKPCFEVKALYEP